MPLLAYHATFTVGTTIAGFDIRTSAYNEETTMNATVRPIPWSQTYAVVIQVAGIQPKTRRYRTLLYLENDYLLLQTLVGQMGALATPREPNPGGTVNAYLQSVKRGDFQWAGDFAGIQGVDLDFVMTI